MTDERPFPLAPYHVLDLTTGDTVLRIGIDESHVRATFSPDSRVLAVSFGDTHPVTDFWGLATKARLGTVAGHRRRIIAMICHQARDWINRGAVVSRQHERFPPISEDEAPRILRFVLGAIEAIEAGESRAQAPEPGLLETREAPRCLNVGMSVQTLRKPKLAAGSPKE